MDHARRCSLEDGSRKEARHPGVEGHDCGVRGEKTERCLSGDENFEDEGKKRMNWAYAEDGFGMSTQRPQEEKPMAEQKPTPEQKPTIGRVVHYQRYGSPGGEHKTEPSPAVITQIHEDGDCQLFVMNPNGVYFNKTPFSQNPKPGHWSWPPKA